MPKLAAVDIGNVLFGKHAGLSKTTTLGTIVNNLLPNLYLLAGVISFLFLIFAGLNIIIGAGEQSPEKIQKSKATFTWAIIGFLVIFGSYWIIEIVKVVTGIDILKPGGF